MTKQLTLSALALATLVLGGCSAEPSDWRPDKKVSVDMVAPGTRESGLGNYSEAGAEGHGPGHEGGHTGAVVDEPISSGVTLDEPNQRKRTTAEEVRSANDPSAPLTRSPEALRSVKKPSDTTATKALDGPMQ